MRTVGTAAPAYRNQTPARSVSGLNSHRYIAVAPATTATATQFTPAPEPVLARSSRKQLCGHHEFAPQHEEVHKQHSAQTYEQYSVVSQPIHNVVENPAGVETHNDARYEHHRHHNRPWQSSEHPDLLYRNAGEVDLCDERSQVRGEHHGEKKRAPADARNERDPVARITRPGG
jgi:hypothetical protein